MTRPYNDPMPVAFWFRAAAYLTWVVCGVPAVAAFAAGELPPGRAVAALVSFAAFGAAFTVYERRCRWTGPRRRVALLAICVASALTLTWATKVGLAAALLVVTAAALPDAFGARAVAAWIAMQSVALTALFWWMSGSVMALVSAGAFIGFQLFAISAAWLAASQSRAREELAHTNAELTATRELLAENSRVAERLRIARDLHDALGHHLTALTIQLDVASRLTEGQAAASVREAHAVAKLLLGDVRSVVSTLRGSSRFDLAHALRALASAPGTIRIHLQMPDRLHVDDAAQAHALVRCVQEIITNTARHASAQNLWIAIAQRPDGIDLQARDDGRGAPEVRFGNGLRGMRERFEEYAGRVEVRSAAGQGFEVHGFMPLPEIA